MDGTEPTPVSLVTLTGPARFRAVPVLEDGFRGIYRWHAKRTLRSTDEVRALETREAAPEVVGVALLERLLPEIGYVYYLAVFERYRGRGLGGRLLDDAIARFGAAGAKVVYGAVEEGNTASERLFRSRGFRVVERGELNYRDGGLGVEGLRARMWVVRGERVFGLRLSAAPHPRDDPPPSPPTAGKAGERRTLSMLRTTEPRPSSARREPRATGLVPLSAARTGRWRPWIDTPGVRAIGGTRKSRAHSRPEWANPGRTGR